VKSDNGGLKGTGLVFLEDESDEEPGGGAGQGPCVQSKRRLFVVGIGGADAVRILRFDVVVGW